MSILQRYILRETLVPMGLGLAVFTFVILVGQIFKIADLLLNSGIPAGLAGELFLLILPGVMSLTVPMAVLVGILLGVGRLAADREILAIRTSGVNLVRIFFPVLVFAGLVSVVMIFINMQIIPYLNLKSEDLKVQVLFNGLSAVPPNQAFEMPTEGQSNDSTLFYDAKDTATGEMRGITMHLQMPVAPKNSQGRQQVADAGSTASKAKLKEAAAAKKDAGAAAKNEKKKQQAKKDEASEQKVSEQERRRLREQEDWQELENTTMQEVLILAQKAALRPDIQNRVIYLELSSGSLHLTDPHDVAAYDIIGFDTLVKGIVPGFDKFEQGVFDKAPREMSNRELHQQIQRRDKGRKYSAELYQRYSIPLACVAFAMIALPLAVYVRPTGKAIAFAISFLLILVYYGLLNYGIALSRSDSVLGPAAIFLPNVLISAVGVVLMYRMVTK